MPETPITTTGTVRDVMGASTFHVALPNGKIIVGHLPRRLKELGPSIEPGRRVALELTPYDFEKARIAGLADHA